MRGWLSIAVLCALGMFGCAQLLGIETGSRGEGGSAGAGGDGAGGQGAGGEGAGGEGAGGNGGTGGTGGTPRCGMLDQLVDEFESPELLPRWNAITQLGGVVSVDAGAVTLSSIPGSTAELIAAAARTITGSSVVIDIELLTLGSGDTGRFAFRVEAADRQTWMSFEIDVDQLEVWIRTAANGTAVAAARTYNPSAHRFLRFVENAGEVSAQTCAQVPCPQWDPLASEDTVNVLPEGHALVAMAAYGGVTSDSIAVIDSVNAPVDDATDEAWCPITALPRVFDGGGWADRYKAVGCNVTLGSTVDFNFMPPMGDSCHVASSQAFDLTGRRLVFSVDPFTFNAGSSAFIQLVQNRRNRVDILLEGMDTQVSVTQDDAPAGSIDLSHNLFTHPYIALQESGGILEVLTSARGDGVTFTAIGSLEVDISLKAVKVLVAVGGNATAPASATYALPED